MIGVCTRWAVVRIEDGLPIEGTLYSDKAKANKRRAGSHDPEQFRVEELAVMPLAVALRLIDAVPNGSRMAVP